FTSVEQLLAGLNGQGSSAGTSSPRTQALKKNVETLRSLTPSPSTLGEGRGEGSSPLETKQNAPSPLPSPCVQGEGGATSASAIDDDDDLPRPGKVFEGPSLKELLKQPTAFTAKSAPSEASNIEPA